MSKEQNINSHFLEIIDKSVIYSATDIYGNIVSVTDAFCKISGYAKEELIGKPHKIVRHPDMSQEIFKDLWQTIRKGDVWQNEIKNLAKNGHSYWVLATVSPIISDNKIVGYQSVRQDITDKKLFEEDTKNMLELALSPIIQIYPDGKISFMNEEFARMLKIKKCCEHKERFFFDLVEQGDIVDNFLIDLKNIDETKEIRNVKLKYKKTGSGIIYTENNVKKIGEHIFIFAHDITKREAMKKAYEKIKKTEESKSAFLATISHELRTPLNSIISLSSVLVDNNNLNPEENHWLGVINKSGLDLLELVNDILDTSKIIAGQTTLNISNFDVCKIVEEVCEQLRPVAANKNIQIEYLANEKFYFIKNDKIKLKQIVRNFLSNAVKFSIENKNVDIVLKKIGLNLEISVKDRGIGISRDNLDKIFEPFSKIDYKQQKGFEGTGLGLFISKRLAQAMGGEIRVESREGEGSTFYLTINPSFFADKEKTANEVSVNMVVQTYKNVAQPVALIVTEKYENALMAMELFDNKNWKYIFCFSQEEAKDIAKINQVDLVVGEKEVGNIRAIHFDDIKTFLEAYDEL